MVVNSPIVHRNTAGVEPTAYRLHTRSLSGRLLPTLLPSDSPSVPPILSSLSNMVRLLDLLSKYLFAPLLHVAAFGVSLSLSLSLPPSLPLSLSLFPSLSHTHTHARTHMRTHARTHAHAPEHPPACVLTRATICSPTHASLLIVQARHHMLPHSCDHIFSLLLT